MDISWSSRQATHCSISISNSFSFVHSVVYASTKWQRRKMLLEEIRKINFVNVPHTLVGDFNCISDPSHKKGGKSFSWGPGEMDLITLKNDCSLTNLSPSNEAFTWLNNQPENSRIWERLDFALANPLWISSKFSVQVFVLERIASDHSPLLLKIENQQFQGKRVF